MLGKSYVLHLRDGPNRQSLAVENHSIRKMAKGLTVAIGVASGRFHAGKLDGESSLRLAREGLGGCVKSNGPIVNIGVIRVRPDSVCLAAEHTPVHVIEVGGDVARAHVEVDAVGEVLGKVVDRPVQAVLVRRVGARGVPRAAVPELTAAAIGRADAPQLRAGGLWDPGRGRFCGGSCLNHHAILCVLSEDAVAVDGQAVRSSLDARQCNGTVGTNVTPVLVRLCVEVIVLEVEAIAGKDGDGVGDTGRECDLTLPGTAARSLDVARDILSNGIVELRIPGRVRELSGISTQCLNRGSFGGFVEIVIGLSYAVSSFKISTKKSILLDRMCDRSLQ